MDRLQALLTLEKAGQLPPDKQKALDTLRAAGEVAPKEGDWSVGESFVRPGMQALGAGLGAAAGLPGGLPTMGLGAGLGYAGAGKAYDIGKGVLAGEPVFGKTTGKELGTAALNTAQDVATGAALEYGGQAAGKYVVEPLARRLSQTRVAQKVLQRVFKQDAQASEELAQSTLGKTIDQQKRRLGQTFDQIETLGGDEPIVPVPQFRAKLIDAVTKESNAPFGVPAAMRRAGQASAPDPKLLFDALRGEYPELGEDALMSMAQQLASLRMSPRMVKELATNAPSVIGALTTGEKVSVATARQAERELSSLGGRAYSASPRQGLYRGLAGTLKSDIETFLETDQPGAADALRAAKDSYRQLRGEMGRLLPKAFGTGKFALQEGGATKTAEDAIGTLFKPGSVTVTRDLQNVLPPDEYNQLVETWLRSLQERAKVPNASGGYTYNATRFAKSLAGFQKNGHLDVIVQPLVDAGILPGGSEALLRGAAPNVVQRIADVGTVPGITGGGLIGQLTGGYFGHPYLGTAAGAAVPGLAQFLSSEPGRNAMQAVGTGLPAWLLRSVADPEMQRVLAQSLGAYLRSGPGAQAASQIRGLRQ